ncbi:hypothetical protein [Comamonas resistens]|uniref:hypothetical protein n=1 Tax=Comamonas resistens TaxID=3046670 RepID=UPI0039BD75C8
MKHQRGLMGIDQLGIAAMVLGALALAFALGDWRGAARERANAKSAQDAAQAATKAGTIVLSAGRDGLQTNLGEALDRIDINLKTEQNHANHESDAYQRGLRAGTVRVSVPVVPGSCTVPASGAAEHAGPGSEQAKAQLDPATAADLDAIAGDGDEAIRELNACIDKYAEVKRTMDTWSATLEAAGHAQTR